MVTGNAINANSTGYVVYDGAGTFTGRTFQAGNGISLTNASGTAGNTTIATVTGGLTWTDVTTSTQQLAVNNGYITDHSTTVTYTLPTTAAIGDTIWIMGKLGLATINYTTNQQILLGNQSSTVTSGTIVSTNVGDSLILVCITANLVFRVVGPVGNWTIT